MAAGLLARNAVERGLTVPPWVKTSLAPGSRVVMDYYDRAGLLPYLEKLGFDLVGVRLHDLHRQLRAAAAGDLGRRQRRAPLGGLGAVGQPELRGGASTRTSG